MNANSLLAEYLAGAKFGKDIGPDSDLFKKVQAYLEGQTKVCSAVLDYQMAKASGADRWVAANGGYEGVTTYRTGRRLLYVYNFKLGEHAYLDLDQDRILDDMEAQRAIGN
jgi:hypothetical protein